MIHLVYAYFGEKFCKKMAALVEGHSYNTLKQGVSFKEDDHTVIRWGSVHEIDVKCYVRNRKAAILETSDKLAAREAMLNAGVCCPKRASIDAKKIKYPVIGRPRIHAAGSSFHVCKNRKDIDKALADGCEYFSEVFKKTHEYRVHCASGKVLYVQDKNYNPRLKMTGKFPDDVEWHVEFWEDYNKEVCLEALKAMDVFDLDFGAVDVMWNDKTKTACVCEINCAPEVASDFTRDKYARYFKWLDLVRANRQFWDFKKFKTAEDMAWRQRELTMDIPKDMQA